MKKIVSILITLLLVALIVVFPFTASAESFVSGSLNSYTYDYWGEGVMSPDMYKADSVIDGRTLGIEALSEPTDMFIDDKGDIYVLDSGNNRVVILNSNGTLKKVISSFVQNGKTTTLNKPSGIYVNQKGEMIIADTQNHRVIKTDSNGKVLLEIGHPGDDFNFTGVDYLPQKVVEDSNNCIYVLCEGIYQGAMMYEQTGEFIGYFGANKIDVTFAVLANAVWRRMMTKEQREKTTKYIPVQFDNMFIDDDGFIYTVTKVSDSDTDQLKKLNPKGVNVMAFATSVSKSLTGKYGDIKNSSVQSSFNKTKLCDVTVDEKGFITVLDFFRGRMFQYDPQGNLMVACGGLGSQTGTYGLPAAIETFNDKIYILDQSQSNITVLSLTDYGNILREATIKYNDGLYSESEELWKEVLSRNNNLTLAYIGLGKIYYEKGEYETAMKYFKLGEDRENYGNAFKLNRNDRLRKYVFPIVGIIIIIVVLVFIVKKVVIAVKKQIDLARATELSRKKG